MLLSIKRDYFRYLRQTYPPERSMGDELMVSPPAVILKSPSFPFFDDSDPIVTGVTVTLLRDDKADIAAAATSLCKDLTLRSNDDD